MKKDRQTDERRRKEIKYFVLFNFYYFLSPPNSFNPIFTSKIIHGSHNFKSLASCDSRTYFKNAYGYMPTKIHA